MRRKSSPCIWRPHPSSSGAGNKKLPLHWGSPGQRPAREGVEEPGGGRRGWAGGCGWAAWLPAPTACPAFPLWAALFTGAAAPKPAARLRLTFFHADAGQSGQLLGSRTAGIVTSKCICYIQIPGVCANTVSVQRRRQRCSRPSCAAAGKRLLLTPWSHSPQGGLLLLSPLHRPQGPPPAGSTGTGCNRDPALLCFADNLFSGSH